MELQNRANITIHVGDPEPSLNGEHDYILHAVVTKEDHYRCVVTQDNICHQIYSKETLVPVSSGNDPLIGGMIGCIIVIGVLAAAVAFLLYKLHRNRNSSGQQDDKTNGATSPPKRST
ncbi:hypothetical protein AMECASPLE_029301 [Ameca splendens]|uniref:Uncharacterized protein n=1 Tax=Ameca splendens TaxID=208324 RepID=A0ABV0YTH5_9TELE